MPRVSVIVATYNSSRTLRPTLESIVDQKFRDFEVWVVGDGCTDDSGEVVSALGDARLHWVNLDSNHGSQCWPNNEGLRRSAGEYVAYLGHDDLWFPWHLFDLFELIERTPSQFAYSTAVRLSPDGRIDKGQVGADGMADPMQMSPPSTWLHRRDITETIGFWRDPHALLVQTDDDFLTRARRARMSFATPGGLSVLKFPSVEWGLATLRDGPPQPQYLARIRSDPQELQSYLLHAAAAQPVVRPPRWERWVRAVLRPVLDFIGRERWPLRHYYQWRNRRERQRRRKLRGMPHADGSMTLPPPPRG